VLHCHLMNRKELGMMQVVGSPTAAEPKPEWLRYRQRERMLWHIWRFEDIIRTLIA
jgi:hypothetical protein